MIADIATGHHAAADVLLLIAAVLFVVEAVLRFTTETVSHGVLLSIGLALTALAWLVL